MMPVIAAMTVLETILWVMVVGTIIACLVLFVVVLNFFRTTATKDEVEDSEKRLLDKLENERLTARVALGKVHQRLDNQSVKIGEQTGTLNSISDNVQLLLQRATKNK